MDTLLIVAGIAPMALLVFNFLPFFGSKKEIEALQKEKEELATRLSRTESKLDESRKKLEKIADQLESSNKELEELRSQNRQMKEDSKKARRLERDLAEKQEEIEHITQARDALVKQFQEETKASKERNALLAEEIRRTREASKVLEEKIAQAASQKPDKETVTVKETVVVKDESDRAEIGRLKAMVRELREQLQSSENFIRVLRRKVEHNRRAYTITLMQLELAHDELYLLKTGKARRDTAQAQQQIPGGVERLYTPDEASEELPPLDDEQITQDGLEMVEDFDADEQEAADPTELSADYGKPSAESQEPPAPQAPEQDPSKE